MQQPALIAGLFRNEAADGGEHKHRLQDLWQENLANGYNFTYINISKDLPALASGAFTAEAYQALPPQAFTRAAHRALTVTEWRSFGGMVTNAPAPGLNDDLVTHIFEEAAQWAKYLGMHSIAFDLGRLLDVQTCSAQPLAFYAGLLSRILYKTVYEGFHFWIKTPWTDAGWDLWNQLRSSIGQNAKNRLHVLVDLGNIDTAVTAWNEKLARWYGESVQAVCLPTRLFQKTDKGVVLPPSVQEICRHYFHYLEIKWLIEGPCHEGTAYSAYRDHLDAIRISRPYSEQSLVLMGSTDVLQRPMQPLQDQLHSSNYEVFEKCPVKYKQYELAIRKALLDRHSEGGTVNLMVLGGGRGPLVDAAIRGSRGLPCKLKIFVIEKNPPAVITLKHRAQDDWAEHDVTVVETDMRNWQREEKADIIVSELLGSWGDNELSPECLDGAEHILKEGGISIPASYTSYLAPITSARLHAYTAGQVPSQFPEISSRKFFETTYVVYMKSIFRLADEQPCFTYKHPNPDRSSNDRHVVCSFTMPENLGHCLIHGFRGTFDCTLYADVHISIADSHYSEGMSSWFPLYIPLETPLLLAGQEAIKVHVWRRSSKTKVWYEWTVDGRTHIHNAGGRSSFIGLY